MKNILKKLVLYTTAIAILISFTVSVLAANPNEKCKVTVNGQAVNWTLKPFLAYGPQGNAMILIPMKDFFTTLGYTVTYDSKLNRSNFTANKNSDYVSFYVDLKTIQAVEEGGAVKKGSLECAYLVNDNLYLVPSEYLNLERITESFLNNAEIKVEYEYVYTKREDFITDYRNYFPIQNNLSSLEIEVSEKYPDHPFVGEQYTKYNTGEWISGTEVKRSVDEVTLRSLWDGFDSLHFYTGKSERNELTGKGKWNSNSYAIAWELMNEIAKEINKLRQKDGLSELAVDHSLCFISVGAKDPKVDSVFDNAIHNIENNKFVHTFMGTGKVLKGECYTNRVVNGININQKYDNSTSTLSRIIAENWYKSTLGHKEIMMKSSHKTVGILVIITDTTAAASYAVFK